MTVTVGYVYRPGVVRTLFVRVHGDPRWGPHGYDGVVVVSRGLMA